MINTNYPIYETFIYGAILLNLILVTYLLLKNGYSKKEVIIISIIEVIGIVIGGKLLNYITSKTIEFNFLTQGLSSFGALIGEFIAIFLYSKITKKNYMDFVKILSYGVPLMYGIGKIGCHLIGCCHGIKYSSIFKIMYHYSYDAPNNIYLFPVQLFEAIFFSLIFIYYMIKYKGKDASGKILFSCGLCKFIFDFFRANRGGILTFNSILSICLMLIGIAILLINKEDQNERRN